MTYKTLNTLSQKLITVLLFMVFINYTGVAQAPDWSINENDFEFTMTFVSFLNIDGDRLQDENDLIGAFVGDENRGVTNLVFVESENAYFAFLTVHANIGGEAINFRIYDATNDQIRDVETTVSFEINSHFGNLFQAFSFANPALSSDVEIIDFSFSNIPVISTSIADGEITIDVLSENITSLTPEFNLSTGASLFENGTNFNSGEGNFDFSNPVVFQVRSADQSTLKLWTVTVNQIEGEIIYRKRDAVCYASGAIQTTVAIGNAEASLFQNGELIETLSIVNGVVTFENLDAGVYEVQIGTNSKEITLNLITE